MMNFLGNFISNIASHGSSFFASFIQDYYTSGFTNFFNYIIDILYRLIWAVANFVMTISDALEYIAFSFLGIDMGVSDFSRIQEIIDLDLLTKTFQALFGLAILLMIIFTIIAMIRQEWENATSGFNKTNKDGKVQETNPKWPFLTRIVKNFVLILIMPLLVYFMFAGVTSIVNSFNLALKQNQGSTIASTVLASSTYDANKYRMYATQNQRIPIIINAYDDSDANYDNIDEMAIKIGSLEVQETLRDLATKIANNEFSSFDDSLVVKNNTYYNNDQFSQLHEKFICTAEQYYVMADFVDYAQQNGMTYYIKSIDDSDIEWKYVSSAVYKQASNELVVEYYNANYVNNTQSASAANIEESDKYTITYAPVKNATSPISDALDSIKAILGIGEYGDNLYNVMDRQDGYTNLVTWANEKAFLKLSDNFNINSRNTWTDTDEILIYEYYRWKYNNNLRDYSIEDLKKGIEWDVQLISYKEYYDYVDIYSEERYVNVVCLNNNYYVVHKDETLTDNFGNDYYVLTSHENENFGFLQDSYSIITKYEGSNSKVTLKLSSDFDINNPSNWTPQDQILVYEYFSDSSYKNSLRQYNFDDFIDGVEFDKFAVVNYLRPGVESSTANVVLLNNTYYKVSENSLATSGVNLLEKLENKTTYVNYNYILNILEFENNLLPRYGLQNDLNQYVLSGSLEFFDLDLTNESDQKYENFSLKLSSDFAYNDLSTWSFRDILIFYLYCEGYGQDIDYIKRYGIKGEVGKSGGNYIFKLNDIDNNGDGIAERYVYLKIDDINNISTEGVYSLDIQTTFEENVFTVSNQEVFLNYDSVTDKIVAYHSPDINAQNNFELTSYHLEFSDGFRAYDDSTWTVEDFVLAYASTLGLINTISNIEYSGYDALVYRTNAGKLVYRIGNNVETALFLEVTDDFASLENFLKSKLIQHNSYASYNGKLLEKKENGDYKAQDFCNSWLRKRTDIAEYNNGSGEELNVKFSQNFEASTYSSWTQADFVLYYICSQAYNGHNFQTYIQNGVEVNTVYLVDSDRYGSSKVTKAFRIGESNLLVNFNAFYNLYNRKLQVYQIENTNAVSYQIELSNDNQEADFIYKAPSTSGLGSFIWTDYYYYQVNNTNSFNTFLNNLNNVDSKTIEAIEKLDMNVINSISSINLKLLDGNGSSNNFFDLKSTSNWTILNYIVLKEYSRDIENNCFKGMSFEDLEKLDNYYNLYVREYSMTNQDGSIVDKKEYVVEINGNYYNLNGFIEPDTEHGGYKCTATMENYGLEYSTAGDYSFKVPKETFSFAINPQIKYVIPQTEFTIAFEISDGIIYITPHAGNKTAYQVNLNLLDLYEINDVVRYVSWPQKLMNDMLIMYPDLNWNTLIATGNWVDVLGDYVSSYSNGAFISEGNSSNITAVGMVLSEFFLSVADESVLGYADYEYSSLFDENIIKSLMLSLLGEEEYEQLSLQAEIFVELFNTTFAPILDDIASEYGNDISNGNYVEISTFVYKAFLATQLLSSDLGEYLYTVANRVYAQYTIYESLASAAGAYVEYDQYINGISESLVLRIGTEYYDITGMVKEILAENRLTFKEDNAYVNLDATSILLDAKNDNHAIIINNLFSSFSARVKKSSSGNTVIDAILEKELRNTSPQNVLIGKEKDIASTGKGINVTFLQSTSHVVVQINNNYYNITDYVDTKGDYSLDTLYSEYIKTATNTDDSSILDLIFYSNDFEPSSYALGYAISQGLGDYVIKVKYSGNQNSESKTILDEIINEYVRKNTPPIDTGGILTDYKDWDGSSRISIAEKFEHDSDYSIMAEIYVISNENAFTYATFKDLVRYENALLGDNYYNATPVYTFNMERAAKEFYKTEKGNAFNEEVWQDIWTIVRANITIENKFSLDDLFSDEGTKSAYKQVVETQLGTTYSAYSWNEIWEFIKPSRIKTIISSTTNPFDVVYEYVYDNLSAYYNKTYINKETIGDSSPYFCYMFEVYYSIYVDCLNRKEDIPVYLEIYKQYLDGQITRWNILEKEDITGSSQYIPNYNLNKSMTFLAQVQSVLTFASIFAPQVNFTDTIFEETKEAISSGTSLENVLDNMFDVQINNTDVYTAKYLVSRSINMDNVLLKTNYNNVFEIFEADSLVGQVLQFLDIGGLTEMGQLTKLFVEADNGNEDAWLALVKVYESLNLIIDEMNSVKMLFYTENPSEARTASGSKIAEGYHEESYDDALKSLNLCYSRLGNYISMRKVLDKTIKTSITFTLAQYGKDYVTDYRFNIENRGYTFDSMASPLRLAEYTLGGSFLVKYGIYPAFTSEEFEGLIHTSKIYDSDAGYMKTKLEVWPELKEFAANLAAYTAKLYYTTNLVDMASNVKNAVYLTDLLTTEDGQITTIEYMILEYLCSTDIKNETLARLMLESVSTEIYTSADIIPIVNKLKELERLKEEPDVALYADTEITDDDITTILTALKGENGNNFSQVHLAFKDVMSYLLLSEEQQYEGSAIGINFEYITLTDLKEIIMDKLIKYESNSSEQVSENINRYLALYNLICCEIEYYSGSINETNYVGSNLKPIDIYEKSNNNAGATISYSGGVANGQLHFYDETGRQGALVYAKFRVDDGTSVSILEMANCENQPIEDLVQMEYKSIYNRAEGVYDENDGDVFIVCIFDEEYNKYIPLLAKNFDTSVQGSTYQEYVDRYGHVITTDYYANNGVAFPIVAKGIITSAGLPTAIKIENGEVKYYRTNISATLDISESAMLNSVYSSELSTMAYTTYVPLSQFLPFAGTNKMVNFIGNVNMGNVLKSDLEVYFLQTDVVYNLPQADTRGGFEILADISAHYQLNMQVFLLLFFGFLILLPLIFSFSANAVRRILDIIFLVLAFPLVLASTTISPNTSEEGKAYTDWKDMMKKAMLSIIGYIIGFNCYYILVSTVSRLDFVNIETVNNIKMIGGFGFVSLNTLNAIIRYIFLLQAISLVKGSMDLLLPIVTGGSVKNALASAIDGQDTVHSMTSVVKDVKDLGNNMVSVFNGQALIQMKDAAIESIKASIPGSSIVGSMAETGMDIANKIQGRSLAKAAEKHGVAKDVAKKYGKQFADNKIQQRKNKREKRLKNANAFVKNFASDYMKKGEAFTSNPHLWKTIKDNFSLPKEDPKKKEAREKKEKKAAAKRSKKENKKKK